MPEGADRVGLAMPPGRRWESAGAGAALGLFVGMLLGLSVSPLVKEVMATALALLAAFFGLSGKEPTAAGPPPADLRVIAFCLAGVAATLLALTARTHDWLSPPGYVPVAAKADGSTPDPHATVLFRASGSLCHDIPTISDRPLAAKLRFLDSAGGQLSALSQRVTELPPGQQEDALRGGLVLLCGG